jgi:hypothetical protein
MLNNAEDWSTVEHMAHSGGGFVKALAEAFRHADAENWARLRTAFPSYWQTYNAMARRSPAPFEGFPASKGDEVSRFVGSLERGLRSMLTTERAQLLEHMAPMLEAMKGRIE